MLTGSLGHGYDKYSPGFHILAGAGTGAGVHKHADVARHDAEITTASPASSIRCTRNPARCGNSIVSRRSPSSETSQTRQEELAAPTGGMAD